jgi:hypothetical protein
MLMRLSFGAGAYVISLSLCFGREQQNIKRSAITTQTDLFGYGTVYMVKVKSNELFILS